MGARQAAAPRSPNVVNAWMPIASTAAGVERPRFALRRRSDCSRRGSAPRVGPLLHENAGVLTMCDRAGGTHSSSTGGRVGATYLPAGRSRSLTSRRLVPYSSPRAGLRTSLPQCSLSLGCSKSRNRVTVAPGPVERRRGNEGPAIPHHHAGGRRGAPQRLPRQQPVLRRETNQGRTASQALGADRSATSARGFRSGLGSRQSVISPCGPSRAPSLRTAPGRFDRQQFYLKRRPRGARKPSPRPH
jgi:hypothetical protein